MDLGLLVSGPAVTQQGRFQGAVQCSFCFLCTQTLSRLVLKEPLKPWREFKCQFQQVLVLSGLWVSAHFMPLCPARETKGQRQLSRRAQPCCPHRSVSLSKPSWLCQALLVCLAHTTCCNARKSASHSHTCLWNRAAGSSLAELGIGCSSSTGLAEASGNGGCNPQPVWAAPRCLRAAYVATGCAGQHISAWERGEKQRLCQRVQQEQGVTSTCPRLP